MTPVPVTYRDGTIAPPRRRVPALPGFEYLIGAVGASLRVPAQVVPTVEPLAPA